MASWNIKFYSVKGSIRQRRATRQSSPSSRSIGSDRPRSRSAGAEGGLLVTTPHHYAGASATRDRRDRDDPREALADLGRRDDDEPRDVTDALDR